MHTLTIGLDIAKTVFQVHGVDRHGKMVLQRKLSRSEVVRFFSKLEPCLIGIEACHGSHYWGRELTRLGHAVRLIPTQYVKPFLLGGKNDANDAAAISAAVKRPGIHFVPIKSADQQAVQSLHRMRERLIQERTAKSNQIRSMYTEEGFVFAIGITHLRKKIREHIDETESRITITLRQLAQMYLEQLESLEKWIVKLNDQIKAVFNQSEACQQLATVPGIGPITATAIVASVGDPRQFKNGRQFAAWLGLTPQQRSSGGKTVLGRITKRGDTYLRTLFVQGARAVMRFVGRREDRHSRWIQNVMKRRHQNIAAVALANKTARIAWAVMSSQEDFCAR